MGELSRKLFFVLVVQVVISCAGTKHYEKAVTVNSISAYENFLEDFPKSKHRYDVNERLVKLYDIQAWKKALAANTISGYEKYIINQPNGDFVEISRVKIEEIEKQNKITNAWGQAKLENTIDGYRSFIESFPLSSFVYDARSRIRNLQEENAWRIASEINSIEAYADYLNNYSQGKYSSMANSRIAIMIEEKEILPAWREAVIANSYKGYMDFVKKYPSSSYSKVAKEKIEAIQEEDWDKACRVNSIKSYKDFIEKYPYNANIEIAEKKIIDLEVDKIFNGEHGQLPPMNKSSYGYSPNILTNSIEIFNNTKYILTIRYSGIESRKISIPPKQKVQITLKNGSYRITASVNASNVRNYAGMESLIGGEYSSEYYIQTQTY